MFVKILGFDQLINGNKVSKECAVDLNPTIQYPVLVAFDPDMKVGTAELEVRDDGVYADIKPGKKAAQVDQAKFIPQLKGHVSEKVNNVVTAIRPIAVGLVKKEPT